MPRRPTKDIWIALARLDRAAAHLTCHGVNYGGSIEADILAVKLALNRYYDAAKALAHDEEVGSVDARAQP